MLASDICFAVDDFRSSHAATAWFREATADFLSGHANDVRKLNLEVLNRGSIQAITFPSAHVASTMAVALVLTRFLPADGRDFPRNRSEHRDRRVSRPLSLLSGRSAGRDEALIIFLVCVWVIVVRVVIQGETALDSNGGREQGDARRGLRQSR